MFAGEKPTPWAKMLSYGDYRTDRSGLIGTHTFRCRISMQLKIVIIAEEPGIRR
jgi:hypothetical protein